jgi:hypothetical protein
MAPDMDAGVVRKLDRMAKRHQNETGRGLSLIERSSRLELLQRSPMGDQFLINFTCRTLRIGADGETFEREHTPVIAFCPTVGLYELTRLRVATELLPPGEHCFHPNIDRETGLICTGSKWTPVTYAFDLIILTAYDILRGANVTADPSDCFCPEAIPLYQRLRAEGRLPLDSRPLV